VSVTITNIKRTRTGNSRRVHFDIAGDSSYAAGGEALAAADLNLLMPEFGGGLLATDSDKIDFWISEQDVAGGRSYVLDRVNDKVLAYDGGTEVAGATNLTGVVCRCVAEYNVQPSG